MKKNNSDPLVEYTYQDHRDYQDAERKWQDALVMIAGTLICVAIVAGGYFVGWLAIWLWRMV